MPEYRRILIEGGTYFFTLVTYQRRYLFTDSYARSKLYDTIMHVMTYHPFTLVAYCILPDHMHMIWTLPEGDSDYSMRIGLIKTKFSKLYRLTNGSQIEPNISRVNRREAAIWQRRFWEHMIRDEQDLERHINYIHYNPVKHGLVNNVIDWPNSSFSEYVRSGSYEKDWGGDSRIKNDKVNFGE